MKILDLLKEVKMCLKGDGIPNFRSEAEQIISNVLCKDTISLHLDYDEEVKRKDILEIFDIVNRRTIDREPLQYIFGKVSFYNTILKVNSSVLIPRKETELLVDKVLEEVKDVDNPKILDLGTGSGAIAIAIAKARPDAQIFASDISKEALEVAKMNANINGAKISFVEGDLFSNLVEKFDIIVSNPPYVSNKEYEELSEEIRLYEPKLALVAEDGLEFYRRIVGGISSHLELGGKLILEIGYTQRVCIKEIAGEVFETVNVYKDYSGNDRVVLAKDFKIDKN